ncbi:MAG: hypothetical protein GY799_29255 [Desulfobulbaceae bacterium]|nr:hypothetical protein [Desulfobulbaceae bacterium]
MQSKSVPRKQVAISEISVKESKARQLFILADGKRSLGQIYQLCKLDENLGYELAKVLLDAGYISMDGSGIPAPAKDSKLDQQSGFTADFIERLTNELANYVGPVAGMLVKRITLPEQGLAKEDIGRILSSLSEEIEGDKDKQQFLKNMKVAF